MTRIVVRPKSKMTAKEKGWLIFGVIFVIMWAIGHNMEPEATDSYHPSGPCANGVYAPGGALAGQQAACERANRTFGD